MGDRGTVKTPLEELVEFEEAQGEVNTCAMVLASAYRLGVEDTVYLTKHIRLLAEAVEALDVVVAGFSEDDDGEA